MGTIKKNQWSIAIRKRKPNDNPFESWDDFRIFTPPEGTYQADPFLVEYKDKTYLFYELYDYNKGCLAVSEVTEGGLSKPEIVLDSATHLSFPSVWEDHGSFYMVPENVLSGELVIYQAKAFPYTWTKYAVVAVGRYDDPILYKHNGKFFCAASIGTHQQILFTADALNGTWNLIRAEDKMNIRPAGNVFEHNGHKYFPTQRFEKDYGDGLLIRDLETLEVKKIITPIVFGPQYTGLHSFSLTDKFIAVDLRKPL